NAVSDNIANVNTTGFKQILSSQQDLGIALFASNGSGAAGSIGDLPTATYTDEFVIDRLQGPLESPTIRTDPATEGAGRFAVRTGNGLAYTRAGDLVIDATNTLTTQLGQPILDTTGRAIVVPGGASAFDVAPDGTVQGTGQRIALVSFPETG